MVGMGAFPPGADPGGAVVYIQGPDLAMLARVLAGFADGKQLRGELVKGLRAATKPAVVDVQNTVRSLPVSARRLWEGAPRRETGSAQRAAYYYRTHSSATARSAVRRRGLRDGIARGIKLRIRTGMNTAGISIRQDPSNLPPDQRMLPSYMDQGHWRHPLFGDRKHWVEQSAKPYFYNTLDEHRDDYLRGVQQAMEAVSAKIAARSREVAATTTRLAA